MALAAYNAGAGRMARLVKEHGTRTTGRCRAKGVLPTETAAFVPQFAALCRILDQPGRHGLRGVLGPGGRVGAGRRAAHAWTCACSRRPRASPRETLTAGNPELQLGVTPPASYGYR